MTYVELEKLAKENPPPQSWFNETDHEGREEDDPDEDSCQFPGQCCMPGPHFSHECHTAEMIEQYIYRTIRGLP